MLKQDRQIAEILVEFLRTNRAFKVVVSAQHNMQLFIAFSSYRRLRSRSRELELIPFRIDAP
jgi:hypothetical protein